MYIPGDGVPQLAVTNRPKASAIAAISRVRTILANKKNVPQMSLSDEALQRSDIGELRHHNVLITHKPDQGTGSKMTSLLASHAPTRRVTESYLGLFL